jgi:hypothetical protein
VSDVNVTTPAPSPPPASAPPLAGEQVANNTFNIGAGITAALMVLGIAKEYGINLAAWFDPNWVAFATDPRMIATATSAAIWAGNVYRKSRLRRIIVHHLDRLDG